ncbi:hypothetical protein LSM04_004687 [Trypanosoma melophagium]|uniref:uncharacterized protein n=1 Tax=Trypanosoma melophagium TaxID=715481 RepID=UPI00351A1FF6|nr:hypothetical protein LSM04_004687 [Trypanosoma melophagium]
MEQHRPALQPREVKFSDLAAHPGDSPPKSERRGFRPTPQKTHTHGLKSTPSRTSLLPIQSQSQSQQQLPFAHPHDGDVESDEDDKRRGRQGVRENNGGGGGIDTTHLHGHSHTGRTHKSKNTARTTRATVPATTDPSNTRMEIAGSAVWAEDYAAGAVNALAELRKCVALERRLKEELARTNAAKLLAFRGVINVYLASIKQCGKPMLGRRKAGEEFALAQCAVVAQTLTVTIQSYVRAFQSRRLTAARHYLSRGGSNSDNLNEASLRMLQFQQRLTSEGSILSETTSSLHELLDDEEISRLKQLYFDYYDCDVYVIPGTRPESSIPPNALLLNSLSAHDPFFPEDGMIEKASLSSSSISSIVE